MIELAWTVLCTKMIVDPQSNNATLVELVEQVSGDAPPAYPAVIPLQLELVSLFYRIPPDAPAKCAARVTVIGSDGRPVGDPNEFQVDLTIHPRARAVAKLPGLVVTGEGVHFLMVEIRTENEQNWRTTGKVPYFFSVLARPVAG